MLGKLSSSLKESIRNIAKAKRIDKRMVDELVRDIQRALIQADVKISLVKELSDRIRERSLKEKMVLNPRAHVIKVVYEELINIIGKGVEVPLKPQKIMMVGLHGAGKTSSCAKLARYFQKKGLKPAVICADVYRPGASDQLRQLCDRIGVPFYDGQPEDRDVLRIVNTGVKELDKYDIKIIDTAGRHALEPEMIDEIKAIEKVTKPEQRFIVLDASIGQQASVQAKAFNDAIGITGIIITKMDGTAKGGGALSAVAETDSGVAFIGTGETVDDFEKFESLGFISRMLGMGDIKSLIEMAEDSLKAEDVDVNILKGKFTLKDLYTQLEMLKKMGPFKKLMQMLPLGGLGVDINNDMSQITADKLKLFKVMMDSMTDEELTEPKIIGGSRLRRIARGSGTSTAEVNELMKYHRMMKKMMKSISSGRGNMPMMKGIPMGKMMKKMR